MEPFEIATSAVPSERKCIQGTTRRLTNFPVGDCFFGVPPDPLYGREPLETLPASATRFHFYLGSDAVDLIAAFTKSKFAAAVTHLSIGDCSYAADCDYEYAAEDSSYADGSWLDFTAVVNTLGGGRFPSLRSFNLGVCQLFHNQSCGYGRLGNVTRLFDAMPSLEELGLYGCFELASPVVLPVLRWLGVLLDDDNTGMNGGAISQGTFENLLCSQMPNLTEAFIDLKVTDSEATYAFPDSFLTGANVPSLTAIEFEGSFAPDTRERWGSSELARRPGLRIVFSSSIMTEGEWNTCTDSRPMLKFLQGKASERKLRLFACACCRSVWHLLTETCHQAVQAAEQYGDGEGTLEQLQQLRGGPHSLIYWITRTQASQTVNVVDSVRGIARDAGEPSPVDPAVQTALLRHLVGNPFKPYPAPASWPSTVIQLAQALYNGQNCSFALHDALLEAGHPNLAKHFKEEQSHPKGCCAVDLILGKK